MAGRKGQVRGCRGQRRRHWSRCNGIVEAHWHFPCSEPDGGSGGKGVISRSAALEGEG